MKQETFSDNEYGNRKRKTKREEFLEIMEDPLTIEVAYSEATGEASISIKLRDSEFEDSSQQEKLLV